MPNPICQRRSLGNPNEIVPPPQFRTFDGINDDLQSASTIDLSGTNKFTVAFWLWWDAFANDDKIAMEFGNNYNLVGTAFIIDPNAGSPVGTFRNAVNGDVGKNEAAYTRPTAAAWHHYAITFDKSQAANETDMYIDGVLQTPSSRPTTNNNTNNFGNLTLNVMARDNTSLFGAGRMARLALWPGVILTAGEVGQHYRGVLATKIQASSNPYYWPITGTQSPELSRDGRGINMTVNG